MTQNKKILLISIISGLISIVLIVFIIYPLFEKIRENSKKVSAVKQDLLLSRGKAGSLEQVKETYENLKPDLEKIDGLFVDPQVPINLIQFWEKTATESGISIDISPAFLKASEVDPWNSIAFQVTLIGSFPNFLKFLEKIENASYLIEIQSLTARRLIERELKPTEQEQYSLGDVRVTLLTKVFTK